MKKVMLALMFCVSLGAAAFAADDVSSSAVHFGVAFPQIFNLNPSIDNVDSESYSAWGFNFGGRIVVGLPFGLYADGSVYFPYSYKLKSGDTTTTYSLSDSGTSFWGISGQLGAYSVLVNTGRFLIPFGVGVHLNYLSETYDKTETTEISQSAFSLGIGGWINAELSLTEKITLYGGVRVDFDFWQHTAYEQTVKAGSVSQTKEITSNDGVANLFVTPVVGFVFRF